MSEGHLERLDEPRRRLVAEHRYLVERIMRRHAGRIPQRIQPDARQQIYLALIYAARVYDRDSGVPFAGFAHRHAVGALWRFLRRERRHQELGRAVADGLSDRRREGSVLTTTEASAREELSRHAAHALITFALAAARDHDGENPEERAAREQARTALRRALDAIDGGLRRVVDLHFYEHRDMKAVAEELGVAYPTARRRRERAIEALRTLLGHGVAPAARSAPAGEAARHG